MSINTSEALALGLEGEQLIAFLTKALKKDADGKSKLDHAEVKELLKRITALAAHVTRDALD